ncbi:HAUS1 protein, partial [Sula dactylatra]|nr:HAUS1 protein [Sula dactylatra]
QVTLWLQKIFGNEPMPQYEVNARTVDILYELVKANEATKRDISLLIKDIKQQATQYKAQAKRLEDILGGNLHLSPLCLSGQGTRYCNAVVKSAMTLETKDTSPVCLCCAIGDMNSELYKTISKNGALELELMELEKKLTAAVILEEQLQEDLKKTEELLEVEKDNIDTRSQDMKFLRERTEFLRRQVKDAEEQLAATGLEESLQHESLMSLAEKLAGLQHEIEPLKKKLESYLDLSP